jgi:hypothetical protein
MKIKRKLNVNLKGASFGDTTDKIKEGYDTIAGIKKTALTDARIRLGFVSMRIVLNNLII